MITISTDVVWLGPVAIAAAVFIAQVVAKNLIEQSVRGWSESKIETLRSEMRATEERLKSNLREKESEIEAIRASVFEGRANVRNALNQRRILALERVWQASVQLSKIQGPSMMVSLLKIENIDVVVESNPQFKSFLQGIVNDEMMQKLGAIRADDERPFVSDLTWAYYAAYRTVITSGFSYIKVLSLGLKGGADLVKSDHIKKLIVAVLPHYANWLDTHGAHSAYLLLEEIGAKLLAQIRSELDSPEIDRESVLRSAEILKQVNEITERDAAGSAGLTALRREAQG